MIDPSSFIALHARQTPERCALKYRGEEISYAAFHTRIQTVGGWLASRGIGPDDVVAVLMKNSPAFLDIAFAASHIGAIFLPINFRLASDEIAYIVENSGARARCSDVDADKSLPHCNPVQDQRKLTSTYSLRQRERRCRSSSLRPQTPETARRRRFRRPPPSGPSACRRSRHHTSAGCS